VLFWAAHGKSAWETGRILNLTEATVKSYIASACKRLNAQNKVHAVAICMALGVFHL
jgi:LuxR family quorum sensing-dependent transcriptional regulator